MKKLLAIVLASCLALSMVACGGASSSTPAAPSSTPAATSAAASTAEKTEAGAKVGVCIYKYDDNFMTLYREELQKYLEEKNCSVTVVDGKNDQAEQTNQINAFIADKVDVLIVNLVQSSAAATVIDLAKTANIPVIFINREPSK
ncbi:MAG: substrate-binding domain-containing protein, partial [Ruthenibacterium sp.]